MFTQKKHAKGRRECEERLNEEEGRLRILVEKLKQDYEEPLKERKKIKL